MQSFHETPVQERPEVDADEKVRKSWQSRLVGSPVLLIVIFLHLLLGFLAALWIVERQTEKKKPAFTEGVPVASASASAARQQTKVTERKNAIAVPDITPMIAVTDQSTVNLPDVVQPTESASSSSSKMEGTAMEGSGIGNGGNGSAQMGMDVGADVMAQAVMESAFGSSQAIGLEGQFYDLKQTATRGNSKMDIKVYADVVTGFVNNGWKDGAFDHYFKSPKPLYAPQIFMPRMDAADGPKAFHVQNAVKPTMWVVLYKGQVQVKHSGSYRFVGFGDDVLVVAINRKTVLDACWPSIQADYWTQGAIKGEISLRRMITCEQGSDTYHYDFQVDSRGSVHNEGLDFVSGPYTDFVAGTTYDIQILVGEHPGGDSGFWLMYQDRAATYKTTPTGAPILPLFKVAEIKMPATNMGCPPYDTAALTNWTLIPGSDSDSTMTPPIDPDNPQ